MPEGNDVGCVRKCGKVAVTRGLCSTCYNRSLKAVRERVTTWAELEKLGLSRPTDRRAFNRAYYRDH